MKRCEKGLAVFCEIRYHLLGLIRHNPCDKLFSTSTIDIRMFPWVHGDYPIRIFEELVTLYHDIEVHAVLH